jgi:hypothetical protein
MRADPGERLQRGLAAACLVTLLSAVHLGAAEIFFARHQPSWLAVCVLGVVPFVVLYFALGQRALGRYRGDPSQFWVWGGAAMLPLMLILPWGPVASVPMPVLVADFMGLWVSILLMGFAGYRQERRPVSRSHARVAVYRTALAPEACEQVILDRGAPGGGLEIGRRIERGLTVSVRAARRWGFLAPSYRLGFWPANGGTEVLVMTEAGQGFNLITALVGLAGAALGALAFMRAGAAGLLVLVPVAVAVAVLVRAAERLQRADTRDIEALLAGALAAHREP